MQIELEKLERILSQLTQEEYGLLGILTVAILVFIYLCLLAYKRKKQQIIADHKVQMFQKTFDVSQDPVLILSDNNQVLYANRTMVKFFRLKRDFLNHTLTTIPQIKIKESWLALDKLIHENENKFKENTLSFPQVRLRFEYEEGVPINLYIQKTLLNDKETKWCNIISIQDLRKEHEYAHGKHIHPITKMPTEIQGLHDFHALYSKIHLENTKVALVLLHLDNLAMVRAIVGYEQANKVLIKFADYLNNIVTDLDVSAYHTFDNNFLLSISNISSSLGVISLVEEIQEQVALLYKMDELRLHLTISAGISIYPDSGTSRKLLDNAYKALYEAQKSGEGRVHIYIPDKTKENYDEFTLHNEMYSALEKNEFEVYYQPVFDAKTKEIVSAEALVRWVHPEHGIIAPNIFIPLMEKTGFIIELGHFVLVEVLKQQKHWELFQFKQIVVAINVASIELAAEGFVENVERQLNYHKINPELIRFEITENYELINEENTQKYFYKLKKLGVGITLDDFGTGYSSFSYLKQFPGDLLKIDRTLVDDIVTNSENQRIVKAMIELGHTLGMKVVVEGIEDKKMSDLAILYECDYIQGYYFSKPIPVYEFQKLLS
ncbi:MAG: GGDEF domain-containing phosphodiesterase [Sulfurovum sp.]|nr:GGDEF domain-containing phosphodiesterase [Sulfurovum sp.]